MVLILECIVVCFILFVPCVIVIANGIHNGAFLFERVVQERVVAVRSSYNPKRSLLMVIPRLSIPVMNLQKQDPVLQTAFIVKFAARSLLSLKLSLLWDMSPDGTRSTVSGITLMKTENL